MKQIQMNQSKNLSVDDAYDLFIRKCRVKNLSQASIVSYENKIQPFVVSVFAFLSNCCNPATIHTATTKGAVRVVIPHSIPPI